MKFKKKHAKSHLSLLYTILYHSGVHTWEQDTSIKC